MSSRIYTRQLACASRYVFVGIETFGHVNGAHINPAITLLFSCTQRISFIKGQCSYWRLSQTTGFFPKFDARILKLECFVAMCPALLHPQLGLNQYFWAFLLSAQNGNETSRNAKKAEVKTFVLEEEEKIG